MQPRAAWSPAQGHTKESMGGRLHIASASEPGAQARCPGPCPPGKGEGSASSARFRLLCLHLPGASASGKMAVITHR